MFFTLNHLFMQYKESAQQYLFTAMPILDLDLHVPICLSFLQTSLNHLFSKRFNRALLLQEYAGRPSEDGAFLPLLHDEQH